MLNRKWQPSRLRDTVADLFRHSHRRWELLHHRTRHWITNIFVGVLFAAILHMLFPGVMRYVENAGLDRMMAIHAVIGPAPPAERTPPRQLFVNVDDATWRDKDWGGGEPSRAPRPSLLKLIEIAFDHGAQQVVLDVLVESSNAANAQDQQEDTEFANGLRRLLANRQFNMEKQLVLVRSLRNPLGQLAFGKDNAITNIPSPSLSELRQSPLIDPVVADSSGRIVLAAPYFILSPDHVLRDWQLLKVVCEHNGQGQEGLTRIIPSVQLLVAARHFHIPAEALPKTGLGRCAPLSLQEPAGLASATLLAQQQDTLDKAEREAVLAYWSALQKMIIKETRSRYFRAVDIGDMNFDEADLQNRVIFRSDAIYQVDHYFDEISARLLLAGDNDDMKLDKLFGQRVVVIGQSFVEAKDRYDTPMGGMPGSVVLMNAIDSMTRYPLIQPPFWWQKWGCFFLEVTIVGYAFARWDSLIGAFVSAIVMLLLLGTFSYKAFTYGVWLDFAIPLVSIGAHRELKSWEERQQHKKLRQLNDHGRH